MQGWQESSADIKEPHTESGGKTLLEIVTCPSEYVALSAAHGYALVTGRPAAVIVHVDVGTQVSERLWNKSRMVLGS